jgi:hypothetical protein
MNLEKFWSKVNKNGPIPSHAPQLGQCWVWLGYTRKGYGITRLSHNKNSTVHRIVYELLRSAIPAGLVIDHLCRNRACVNPDHLEPVTRRENTMRGVGLTAVGAQKTHCLRGHELVGRNVLLRPSWGSDERWGRTCRVCQRLRNRRRRAEATRIRRLKRAAAIRSGASSEGDGK